jgi:nucleoside-diphosphate-sugar epimerase
MKILILGGHGFIGHHLARILTNNQHQVSVVDCHHQYNEFQDWEYHPVVAQRLEYMGNHQFFLGSVTDSNFLDTVFSKVRPDVVVDLATYPNAKMVKRNVADATENMITATAIALDLSSKYQVSRFVLASSSMVYGDFDQFDEPPVETAQCDPLTLYGSYKLQCERMCKIWQRENGLEFVALRPSALYGTRDMVVRVISKMVVSALKYGIITVNGADNRLDFTNVLDVASAFAVASTHSECANNIYNCTRGHGRTILEAAGIIQSQIPSKIITAPADSFYPNRDTLNSSLLQQHTDWQPSIDIEQGIVDYVKWFTSQNYVSRF